MSDKIFYLNDDDKGVTLNTLVKAYYEVADLAAAIKGTCEEQRVSRIGCNKSCTLSLIGAGAERIEQIINDLLPTPKAFNASHEEQRQ
ncbi:hypothetical protein LJC46_08300 [Desulfovibrio sp. OttesenSCG-928-G15]|nr:hypothetical protein [Desulfovibrio sp. OttesenSCG-928-G15]